MPSPTYATKTLEHLGLVASMCDELGLAALIDRLLPQDLEQRQISIGQAVKAMILNGLGFANRRLYLTTHFFQNKPTERLLGPGVQPEHLTDDTLGQARGAQHAYGVTELFLLLSQQALQRLGLSPKVGHLDASSFHVDGSYNSSHQEVPEGVIRITHGYSRDHRPDLNQAVLELIAENQAGIPMLMQALSGNQSDKTSFQEVIQRHVQQLQQAGIEVLVTDSAGYTRATLETLTGTGVTWVMSVPATLAQAKDLLDGLDATEFEPLQDGYEAARVSVTYAGVKQRWLVLRSEAARERAREATERQLLKGSEEERKRFESLARQAFSCEEDAWAALERFRAEYRLLEVTGASVREHKHYAQAGRPAKDALPQRVTYHLEGRLAARTSLLQESLERSSRFLLATNDVLGEVLSDAEVLAAYKDQAKVERGFRFLKDPMFLASTLFLKRPERIMALLMVMTLCLLVYAALEHRIRMTLQQQEAFVPDQKGRPTARPTARWLFELFLDVHLLVITAGAVQVLVMNLRDELRALLELLGPSYREAYS